MESWEVDWGGRVEKCSSAAVKLYSAYKVAISKSHVLRPLLERLQGRVEQSLTAEVLGNGVEEELQEGGGGAIPGVVRLVLGWLVVVFVVVEGLGVRRVSIHVQYQTEKSSIHV